MSIHSNRTFHNTILYDIVIILYLELMQSAGNFKSVILYILPMSNSEVTDYNNIACHYDHGHGQVVECKQLRQIIIFNKTHLF